MPLPDDDPKKGVLATERFQTDVEAYLKVLVGLGFGAVGILLTMERNTLTKTTAPTDPVPQRHPIVIPDQSPGASFFGTLWGKLIGVLTIVLLLLGIGIAINMFEIGKSEVEARTATPVSPR